MSNSKTGNKNNKTISFKQKDYEFESFPEIKAMEEYKNQVEQASGMRLYFQVNDGISSSVTHIQGEEYINFSSYNYLNMSGDKDISQQAIAAIIKYGTSVSGSRLVGGEKPLHEQLENEISALIGTEACIVYNSGHATNVTTIGHIMKKPDLIILDKLCHNSLVQGAVLSGATMKFFKHNDIASLKMILDESRSHHQRVLIVTEGIFSMDGDIPNIPAMIELKKEYGAMLYIDEAHSIGVLGKKGRGIREHFNLNANEVEFWMGTLSKSLASCGGYIAGRKQIIDYFKISSPGFVYSCGISPPDTAAALAAVKKLREDPSQVAILQERAQYFLTLLQQANINTGANHHTPIIPIIVGDSQKALTLCAALRKRGLYLQALFYPIVEEGAARLRAFITSSHTKAQLDYAAQAIIEEYKKII